MFVNPKPRRKAPGVPPKAGARGPRPPPAETSRRVPLQERSRKRVERILEAAALVFAEEGYEAATMEGIAARAETSIGSIYQFFPNKLAVFDALARRYLDRTRALLDDLLASPLVDRPWRELLDAAIDAFAAFHESEPGFRAVWVGVHLTEQVVSEGEAFNRELARMLEGVLGAKLPALSPSVRPTVATMLVETMTAMLILVARRPSLAEAVMGETKTMLRRYLEGYDRPVALRSRRKVRSSG